MTEFNIVKCYNTSKHRSGGWGMGCILLNLSTGSTTLTCLYSGILGYIIHTKSPILCLHKKKTSLFSIETFFDKLVKHYYGVARRHLCFLYNGGGS